MGQVAMSTGLDVLVGGKAKSGVIRVLARRHRRRLTELVSDVSMSKSTVLKAVQSLEASGAVIVIRAGREIVVETAPAAEPMFAALVGFEHRAAAPDPVMPIPGTPLDDTERENFAAFLASRAALAAPGYAWHEDEMTTGIAPGWAGRDPVD